MNLSATREWILESWPKIPPNTLGKAAILLFQHISSTSSTPLLAQHLLPIVAAISLLACSIFEFLLVTLLFAIGTLGGEVGVVDLTSFAIVLKEHLVALLCLATVPLFCVVGCLPPFEEPIDELPPQKSPLTKEKERIEKAATDWEILEVEGGSKEFTLRKAYRDKMRIFHPDKNLEENWLATEVTALIRNAYDRLIAANRQED